MPSSQMWHRVRLLYLHYYKPRRHRIPEDRILDSTTVKASNPTYLICVSFFREFSKQKTEDEKKENIEPISYFKLVWTVLLIINIWKHFNIDHGNFAHYMPFDSTDLL
jgi:hypothetical protein